MPRKTRSTYHHGDLAAALETAARALVQRDGAEGFSLRAAAKAAGVDPAAVYRHYDDKDALLAAVARRGFVEMAADMEQAIAAKRSAQTRLVAVGAAYVHFAAREPELFRLMFGPRRVEGQAVAADADGGRTPYDILVSVLTELHTSGRSVLAAEQAALPAWSAVHGLAMLIIHGRVQDVDAGIRDVTRTILRSLESR